MAHCLPAQVTVRVPGTSANMGPGFDCLGMALDLYDEITLSLQEGPEPPIQGQEMVKAYAELVQRSAATLYERAGRPPPALKVSCENRVPIGRGLGSSATAIVGGLVAANRLCGERLDQEELLELAAELEGHPDNTTPALLGGCRVMVRAGDKVVQAQVPLPPGLRAVLFIPDFAMPTAKTRRLLPQRVSRADAVYNLGRAGLLVAALATGQLSLLREATQDRLHQPYRQRVFPAMEGLIRAALAAGAWGAFLSGGGPAVLALATEGAAAIGQAMASAAAEAGVRGETRVAWPSAAGAAVVEEG